MITNEQAMRQFQAMQSKPESASEALRNYSAGVLYGMASAYWAAGVITAEQYEQLTQMRKPA